MQGEGAREDGAREDWKSVACAGSPSAIHPHDYLPPSRPNPIPIPLFPTDLKASWKSADPAFLLGLGFLDRGHVDKAMECFEKALAATIGRRPDGAWEKHPDTACILCHMGAALSRKGEQNKALEHLRRSLEITVASQGEKHINVAAIYNQMANAYFEKGLCRTSLEYLEKGMAIQVALLDPKHISIIVTLNSMGRALALLGEPDKALEALDRALSILLSSRGEHDPSTAATYATMGSVFVVKRQFDKAIQHYKMCLEIQRRVVGEQSEMVAETYTNMATVHERLGQFDAAEELLRKALVIYRAVLGENHLMAGMIRCRVGNVYYRKGLHDKAISCYQHATPIIIAAVGESNALTAKLYADMALAHSGKGNVELARVFFVRGILAQNAIPGGAVKSDVGQMIECRAVLEMDRGNIVKAGRDFAAAANIYRDDLGDDHFQTWYAISMVLKMWYKICVLKEA